MTGPPPELFRRWVHAREEDLRDVWVYRPQGYPLPPARGRDGIEFRPDGTAQAFAPGPVDAPVDRPPATWEAHPDGTLVLHSVDGEAWFDVLALTEDVLRLARRDPPAPH